MACLTSFLSHTPVVALNLDVVWISPGSKCKGMKEAVCRFGRVLTSDAMWRVAIVACCDRAVAAVDPCRVVVLHHVAVGAGLWIIGQIGISLCIDKRV